MFMRISLYLSIILIIFSIPQRSLSQPAEQSADSVSVEHIDIFSHPDRIFSDQIRQLPYRNMNQFLLLFPGVIEHDGKLHIDGGPEWGYVFCVDGLPTTNPFDYSNGVYIIPEAIYDIRLINMDADASLGGATSGFIQTQLRTGGSKWEYGIGIQGDGIISKSKQFLGTTSYGDRIITATIGGPIVLTNIRFFAALENERIGDTAKRFGKGFEFFNLVNRNFNDPFTYSNPDTIPVLSYPDRITPGNSSDRWAINSTLQVRLSPLLLSLTALYDWNKRYEDHSPAMNLLNSRRQYLNSNNMFISGKINHQISSQFQYDVAVGYQRNASEMHDDYFNNDWMLWCDSARIAQHTNGKVIYRDRWSPGNNYFLYGFIFNRDGRVINNYSKTEHQAFNLNTEVVYDLAKQHRLSAGLQYRRHIMRYFSINPSVMSTTSLYGGIEEVEDFIWYDYIQNSFGYDRLGKKIEQGFDGPKKPVFAAIFLQDEFSAQNLSLQVGLRWDYLDYDAVVLKNPGYFKSEQNQYGTIDKNEWKHQQPFWRFSPRFALSYELNPRTEFNLSYSTKVQSVPLKNIYFGLHSYSNYFYGSMYSPQQELGLNFKPLKTSQLNLSLLRKLEQGATLNIGGFYSKSDGLLSSARQYFNPGMPLGLYYDYQTNNGKSETKGLQVSLNSQRWKNMQVKFHYTFSKTESMDSSNTFYMDYNHSHIGFINLDYRTPSHQGLLRNTSINMIYRFNDGHPFTMIKLFRNQPGSPYLSGKYLQYAIEPQNSSRSGWESYFDLYCEKRLEIFSQLSITCFLSVFNLFNTQNEINVYPVSGTTDDDGFISDLEWVSIYQQMYGEEYLDLYRAIQIDNSQAYWEQTGKQLFNHPRQIMLGVRLDY